MRKVKLVCKSLNLVKIVEVNDLNDSIAFAKDILKSAIDKGIKDPKVRIYDEWGDGKFESVAWTIITKKDIVEKFYETATLTDYELETLKMIINSYKEYGVENSDYYNIFNKGDRKRRGAVSSLIKKQVIDWCNCPNCFNPIYPVHNFKSTCEKYELDISSIKI